MAEKGPKWVEVESSPKPTTPARPLGIYPARVDEKGRLKLPSDFQQYLGSRFAGEGSDARVFITSLDLRIARIYTIPVWEENEKLLENDIDDPQGARALQFLAKAYGGASEIDSQGRVLVPSELRKKLNLEGQPVWLDWYRDGIDVLTKEEYEEKLGLAHENPADRARRFERKGLR